MEVRFRKRRGDVERNRLTETRLTHFLRELEEKEEFLLDRRRAIENARLVHGKWPESPTQDLLDGQSGQDAQASAAAEASEPSVALLPSDLEELATY